MRDCLVSILRRSFSGFRFQLFLLKFDKIRSAAAQKSELKVPE
jgi:hypothetical protein